MASLTNKGIIVHLEPTRIIVFDASRPGDEETALAEYGGEEIEKLYGELRNEIYECEKAKGKTKTASNIARDATIAISSLGHDFFITCDRCLFDSWHKVISKHRTLRQQFKIPTVIYTSPDSKEVTKRVLGLLS